eukprot:scaffold308513_cov24-Prasinocladus_malaysianus.AAC.1
MRVGWDESVSLRKNLQTPGNPSQFTPLCVADRPAEILIVSIIVTIIVVIVSIIIIATSTHQCCTFGKRKGLNSRQRGKNISVGMNAYVGPDHSACPFNMYANNYRQLHCHRFALSCSAAWAQAIDKGIGSLQCRCHNL